MVKKLQQYIGNHKIEIVLLVAILLGSAFLRIYRISDYMTFLGDEGRDAIVAKDILQGNLTLLGPRASAGDFFLGPVYYYMMAPFLLFSGFDPVGPAIMVALFGIATVFLVYYVGLKFFSAQAALTASALYAIAPLVIAYSRSSWNPNPMPFFSLLLLYVLFLAVKNQRIQFFLLVGFLLGITMQLHYISVFLGVIVFLFTLLGQLLITKKKYLLKIALHLITVFGGFLIGLSPFILFEIRHAFVNIRTIFQFIFEDNASNTYLNTDFWGNISTVFFRLFGRLLMKFPHIDQAPSNVYQDNMALVWVSVILAIGSVISLIFLKDRLKGLLLLTWLVVGIFLFGFYKKSIYDYYLGFMFPLPFLLFGGMITSLAQFKKYKKVGMGVAIVVFTGVFVFNLTGFPFQFPGNKQKDQAKGIASLVLSKTNGRPYNFALLARGNSDHVYRYFFEVEKRAPITIENAVVDPERKTVTDQLLIVCEYKDCQPLGNALWEVAGFGRAEIAGSWETPHVKIYKLKHYVDEPRD